MVLGDSRAGKEVNEKWRVYVYADSTRLRYESVKRIAVSESGNHYLTLEGGINVIVALGWRAIEFEGEWMA